MTQNEYLTERLEGQINWYNEKSTINKRWYQFLKTLEIVLASITPFLIALIKLGNSLLYFAGIVSIIAGIVAGVLIAFKFHEKWIKYRTICENLKHEKYMFITQAGIYSQETSFSIFVERVEYLISKENSEWTKIVFASENKPKKEEHENP